MSSDRRWTGGLANREWQRGTQSEVQPLDGMYLARQLEAYFEDCSRFGLDRSVRTALKVIYHRGPVQAAQIGRAYRQVSSST